MNRVKKNPLSAVNSRINQLIRESKYVEFPDDDRDLKYVATIGDQCIREVMWDPAPPAGMEEVDYDDWKHIDARHHTFRFVDRADLLRQISEYVLFGKATPAVVEGTNEGEYIIRWETADWAGAEAVTPEIKEAFRRGEVNIFLQEIHFTAYRYVRSQEWLDCLSK